MKLSYSRAGILLVLAALSIPNISFAQPACSESIESRLRDPGSYESALRRSCIGTEREVPDSDLVTSVLAAMADDSESALSQIAGVTSALTLLVEAAEIRSNSGDLRVQWQQLGDRLKLELLIFQSAAPPSDETFDPPFMSRSDFEIGGTGTTVILSEFEIYKGVDLRCPAIPDINEIDPVPAEIRDCSAFADRIDLLRALRLSENIAAYSTRNTLIAHARDSKQALARWDAYWNDARFQWWWEVLYNGSKMETQGHCKSNEKSIRIGFCQVPNSQWIILHPDVALQWIDGSASSQDLHVSGIIEIFGRNSWKWSGSEITKAFGWSIVASYTNLSGQSNWGYGGAIHWRNRFTLGVTDTDGELGIFLNANLSDLLFERRAKYQEYLQQLEKTDFSSVIFGR